MICLFEDSGISNSWAIPAENPKMEYFLQNLHFCFDFDVWPLKVFLSQNWIDLLAKTAKK